MKIVPDTSVVIDGRIVPLVKELSKETAVTVIIPNTLVSELEHQANLGRETGFEGLSELKSLKELESDRIGVEFLGPKPEDKDIKRVGRIDEMIRSLAEEHDAVLVTSDNVQATVAEAKGLQVKYIEAKSRIVEPRLFKYFDHETMSVHLKEGVPVYAKKGHVGAFKLKKIGDIVSREELNEITREIIEYTKASPQGYMEIEQRGATVIQLMDYRIVIARPPFSDGLEVTAVKPLVKTKLGDYKLSEKLLKRLDSHAEGMFVSGSPGAGKTTFVQALAEYYHGKGKIIKTMEQPRDLQVNDEITQYAPLEGSMAKTSDVLLLVRPDYTIYDEVRKTQDFKVFADMRLAGVGMVGVTHSNKAIDAIQRLVGRVELGLIPHIVDTVIYIDAGQIKKVYELEMMVKVPHGMREADLARPVIQVRDFETGKPEYELYSYGEEVVVIPVDGRAGGRSRKHDQPEYAGIGVHKTKKHIILKSKQHREQIVEVAVDGSYVGSARVNRAGNAKIKRNTREGELLVEALREGKNISLE